MTDNPQVINRKTSASSKCRMGFWLCMVASCMFLCSCSASFVLEQSNRQFFCEKDEGAVTHPTEKIGYWGALNKMHLNPHYSLDYKQIWNDENKVFESDSAFHLEVEMVGKRKNDTTLLYKSATLKNIVIIVNRKDTLEWVMEKGVARIQDSSMTEKPRYMKDSILINNYTIHSLPWTIPTSEIGKDWSGYFEIRTVPVNIKKIRKIRVEITFQFDDYTVTRFIKAKRWFKVWFEPRQGFQWYGPETLWLS